MAQRSQNMASGPPKALGLGIPAALSSNIKLSPNMASEAISQHLILKIFLGEHAPRPPKWVRAYAPSSVPPPNRKYLPPPMLYLERLRQILYNLKVVLGKVTRYSVRETRNWDRYHFPVFVLVRRSQTRVQSARVWLHANIAFCMVGMYVNVDYIMPNKFSNSCSGSV